MPTPVLAALTLACFLASLATLRIGAGFRAWPTLDKINHAVMMAAVWPWVAYGFIAPVPAPYSAAVWAVTAVAFAFFIYRQAQFLRQSKADLALIRAQVAELDRIETDEKRDQP